MKRVMNKMITKSVKKMKTKRFDKRFFAYGAVVLFLLIASILVFKYSKALFFVMLFIALNSIIGLYKIFFRIPIEIELVSLGTVLCTLSFGLKEGLIVAILGSLLAAAINGSISHLTLPMIFGYCVMAFLTPIFSGLGIVLGGILLVLLINILIFIIYQAIGYELFVNAMFSVSNILWNLVLFLRIAPFLMGIMK